MKPLRSTLAVLCLLSCCLAQTVQNHGGQANRGGLSNIQSSLSPSLQITTISLPPAIINVPYSFQLQAQFGSGSLSWTLIGGALPGGITLSSGGLLSGTATNNAANYSFTVQVTDGTHIATQPLTLAVQCTPIQLNDPPIIPPGNQGQAYTYALQVSGGIGPLGFVATGLPNGETINPTTGVISGTPTVNGVFPNIQVTVTDVCPNGVQTAPETLSQTVNATLNITTPPTLPNGIMGQNYSATFNATGGTGGPYTFAQTLGTLPPGLILNVTTGVLAGIPTTPGQYQFTVAVTDSLLDVVSRQFNLTINCTALNITTLTIPNGVVNQPFNFQELSSGGFGTVSWTGDLTTFPPGLSITGAGVVTGTPTTPGPFTPAITATDSCPVVAQTATVAPSMTVTPAVGPPTITTPPTLPQATQEQLYTQQLQAQGGVSPYSWTTVSGTYPTNVGLNVGGTINGTPANSGTFQFTIQATDQMGQVSAPVTFTLLVVANVGPLTITSTSPLNNAVLGQNYNNQMTAQGGTPPYTWSVIGGSSGSPNWTQAFTNPAGCGSVRWMDIRKTAGGGGLANEWYIVCSGNSIYKSTDRGNTWTNIQSNATWSFGPFTIQVDSHNGNLILGTQSTAAAAKVLWYYSTNDGASWNPITPTGYHNSAAGSHQGCAMPSGSFTRLACGGLFGSVGTSAWFSDNDGVSATTMATGTSSSTYSITRNNADGSCWLGSEAAGVWEAPDCQTWTQQLVASVPGGQGNISSFAFDNSNHPIFSAQQGVWHASGSLGSYTWTKVLTTNQGEGMLRDSFGSIYYAHQGNSQFPITVYRSTDQGASFQTWGTGMPTQLDCLMFVQNQFDGMIYSACGNVYRSPIGPGALPPGLSLSPTGAFSGIPTVAGTTSFQVQVKDNVGATATGTFSITVVASAPLQITTPPTLPGATVGAPTSIQIQASGGTPSYAWTQTAGTLPTGVTLSAGGLLAGTPTQGGTFSFTFKVTDSAGASTTAAFTWILSCTQLAVSPVPPTPLQPASQGVNYSFQMLFTGGFAPVKFTGSNFPNGMGISLGGLISGIPTVNGAFTPTIMATDSCTPVPQVVSNVYALQVNNTLSINNTSPLPSGTQNQPYTQTFTASGGTGPYTWALTSGTPQTGLTFNGGSTGTITGTPTVASTVSLTVQVTDSAAHTVSGVFSLTVNAVSGADNRYCNPNETVNSAALPQDGPAAPLLNCDRTARADTPSPGSTVTVTVGSFSSLQSDVTAATCGETILIPACTAGGTPCTLAQQAIYTGNLVFPALACPAGNWVTIKTDKFASLPPEGTRISPAWVGIQSLPSRLAYNQPTGGVGVYLPKLISPGTASTVAMNAATSHFRLEGLELTTTSGQQVQNAIYKLGTSNHIIGDQLVIHGGNSPTWQDKDTVQVAVRNDGTFNSLVDSYVGDIHCIQTFCQDNYAIFAGGVQAIANGPLKAVNNYLEAAGQCLLSGGGGVGATTQNLFDVEFRRNDCYKPLMWYAQDPSYIGVQFDVKNCFELKNANRVLFEANYCQYDWTGQSDQFGTLVELGPKNQASGWSGTASSDNAGHITWLTGQQKFSTAQVSPTCAPGGCHFNFTSGGVTTTYQVTAFTDATHITVTPATPATTSGAYTAYVPGLNPNAQVANVTMRYSWFTHALRCIAIFTVPSDGGDIGLGASNMTFHDFNCDDISTTYANAQGACCAWMSSIQIQNSFTAPNNIHDILFRNFVALSFQNKFSYGNGNVGPSFGFGFQTSSGGGVPNLQIYNGIATAGWNGSKSQCNTANDSVLHRFQCYDQLPPGTFTNSYCLDHNLFATGTQGSIPNVTSVAPYPGDTGQPLSPGCPFTPTGNKFVTSFANINFTGLNGAILGNYLLQNTSPGHLAGSDGKDMGPNVGLMNSMLAGVP